MVRSQCAVISGALVLSLCSGARAQTSVHATADVSAAYSDNAFGVAEDGPEEPVGTFFFMLTPGALLYHDTARAHYSVAYQRHYAFFLEASENNSASDTAAAELNYALSPIQTLTLGLYLTHSSFAGLIADATLPGANEARVGYEAERLRTDLQQTYTQELSFNWRFLQSSLFGVMVPIEAQDTEPLRYRLGMDLGTEYVYGQDAYGVLLGATYFRTAALSDDFTAPDEDVMLLSLRTRWRRNLSLRWSGELSAGLGLAISPDTVSPDGLWGASLFYTEPTVSNEPAFNATLRYNRTQSTSLEDFSIFVSDEVGLDATSPLSSANDLDFFCSTSLGHNRQILQTGPDGSVNVWLSEARVSWAPTWLSLSLRYQYLRQFGATDTSTLPNLDRHLVMLTLAGMFPERRLEPVAVGDSNRVGQQRPTTSNTPDANPNP
ncbi:MAG TPA: hypothetical protein VM686_16170 [Polyangiaceae bacterium]|nr:hypothetical protein [Polyangiaceae bacterium]